MCAGGYRGSKTSGDYLPRALPTSAQLKFCMAQPICQLAHNPLSTPHQGMIEDATALMNEAKNVDHQIKQALRKVKDADDEAKDARLDAPVTS
jgi:hypothetical protein